MDLLTGRIAVVTGAGRGIGRATASLFVAEGATVFGVSRTEGELKDVGAAAAAGSGTFIPCPGDVTDPAFVERLFDEVNGRCRRLDILVNNAGMAPFGSIETMEPERFRKALELNVWAVFLCTQQAVRMMKTTGAGKIVNIGSVRSHWTENGDSGAYNASKYGLRGFTESVARELHGRKLKIAVGMVCPGVVDTSLTNPKGERKPDWLRPETVARAILHAVTAPEDVNVYDTTLFHTTQSPW